MAIAHQLVAVLIMLCSTVMVGAQDLILDLFKRDDNRITLRCRDNNFVAIDNADFWITEPSITLESALEAAGMTYDKPGDGTIEFQLSPSLEGEYFCGIIANSTTSNGLKLIERTSLEQVTLRLAVQFGGKTGCSAVKSERRLLESLSYAVQSAIRDHCNFSCDDLMFGTPELTCSANSTTGNFTVEVTAFEAQTVVADFCRAMHRPNLMKNDDAITQAPVLIMDDEIIAMVQCSTLTEPHEDESSLPHYIIIGVVVIPTALILLILALILTVVKKRKSHNTKKRRNIKFKPVQPVCSSDPPPRSPIIFTLHPGLHSHAEQTLTNPTPNTHGNGVRSSTLPLQNEHPTYNAPVPPLSKQKSPPPSAHPGSSDSSCPLSLQLREVVTLARAQPEMKYCQSPSTYQASDTSSDAFRDYYCHPDNESQISISPRTTPPSSPSHAATVVAQEVNLPGYACRFGHSPIPPPTYKHLYIPPAEVIPVPTSGKSSHKCISLSTLAHQPQTTSSVHRDTPALCMHARAFHSCTCQSCHSKSELCTQRPNIEYITTVWHAEEMEDIKQVETTSARTVYISNSDFKEDETTSAHSCGQIINVSVPFTDTVKCGSAGGVYINKIHDITIEIPKRAIPEGTYFRLSVSAMLHGPFLFPEGVRPVSPIIWLCPQPTLTFSKPIEVVLPHYLHCENKEDTENLVFMKANHYPINGKFQFKPADGESAFKHHTSYGVLHTTHCCFLCIIEKRNKKDLLKTNFSLITAYPRNPQEHSWSVYFGVTYFLLSCIQTFKEQFKDADYQIGRPQKFIMQDTAEKKIEICYQEFLPQQWMAGLIGSTKVRASEVDFWNCTETELTTMEDEKMYPPRFELLIDRQNAVGDSMLTVSFSGIEKELMVKIPLRLSKASQNGVLTRPEEQPQVVQVTDVSEEPNGAPGRIPDGDLEPKAQNRTDELDHDAIELRELCLELQTVDDWFDLGIYLHIPYSKLKIIEVEHQNTHRRRTEMLHAWLNNFQPSWSAVIEALKLIDMTQLAKRLAAKKCSHNPTYLQRYGPTHSQGHCPHQSTHVQLSPTHWYQTSSTARGHSPLRLPKAMITETETETLC